jgi:hypothetical protein
VVAIGARQGGRALIAVKRRARSLARQSEEDKRGVLTPAGRYEEVIVVKNRVLSSLMAMNSAFDGRLHEYWSPYPTPLNEHWFWRVRNPDIQGG